MFTAKKCADSSCSATALFFYDTCYHHAGNRTRVYEEIITYIRENQVLQDLNFSYVPFDGVSFSGKQLIRCRFSRASFQQCEFINAHLSLCFFDFSSLTHTNLHAIDVRSSVFAGSLLDQCDFSGSDIVHTNFNGMRSVATSFNDSDLYSSHFISSQLTDTFFIDCNLKKVNLSNAKLENVSFKYSNYEDADFYEEV
jgi:uncharacterized protein YjbI with pentapeptide repeats